MQKSEFNLRPIAYTSKKLFLLLVFLMDRQFWHKNLKKRSFFDFFMGEHESTRGTLSNKIVIVARENNESF